MRLQVVCLEAYDSEQDAALAHDRAVLAALGAAAPAADLNFPPAPAAQHSSQPSGTMAAAAAAGGDNTAGLGSCSTWGAPTGSVPAAAAAAQPSGASLAPGRDYKGVVWDPANQQYQAQALDSSGNVLLLGLYGTAEEAATEYDTRLIKSGMRDESKLNFSLPRYLHLLGATSHLQQSSTMASGLVAQSSLGMQPTADVDTRLGAAAGSAASGGCPNSPTAAAANWPEAEPGEAAAEAVSGSKASRASGRSKGSKAKGSKGVQKGSKAKGGRTRGNNPVSQYKGVSWSASTQRWAAVMWDR